MLIRRQAVISKWDDKTRGEHHLERIVITRFRRILQNTSDGRRQMARVN